MRLLGLDPGEKRIGVALSDPLGITVQGLEVIHFEDLAEALDRIEFLCREYSVEAVIVGNPLNMDGSGGPASLKAEAFASALHNRLGLKVELVDERLTTSSVEKFLIASGVKRKKRRGLQDKLAAALILETYLSRQKNKLNGEV